MTGQTEAAALAKSAIPVTIIGGYLGAGKTTLVNELLRQAGGLQLAILVNEIGELEIDADLIVARDDNLIAIAGGCICCSYGSDLMAALMDLARRVPGPDHVLVETSGVALPGPVAASITLLAEYAHDATIVLADAETVKARAEDRYLSDTILGQLAHADLVLVNKADLVDGAELKRTLGWIGVQAPHAKALATTRSQVSLDVIVGARVDRVAAGGTFRLERHLAELYVTEVIVVEGPVEPFRLASLLATETLGLLRAKGFVRDLQGKGWVVQVVGQRSEVQSMAGTSEAMGRVVCIGLKAQLDRDRLRFLAGRLVEQQS